MNQTYGRLALGQHQELRLFAGRADGRLAAFP
jgi:hypothetical protein